SFEQPTLIEIVFFEKMQESAYRDELTALYNYRYLKEHLEQEMQRAKRYGSMVSLMMLDIDDFKIYNDQHGHEAGTHVLVKFADLIMANIRGVDTAVRYGGEEFLLILPTTGKIGVVTVYERLQKILREARIKHADGQPLGAITASAGVATFPADAADASELLQHADNAMYVAKKSGKDQIYIYGDNRRSHQRVDIQLEGSYALGDPAQRRPLQTINISEGGMLIVVESQVPDGAILDILLKLPEARQTIPFPGRVMRNEPMDDGNYLVGVRVVEIPTQDRLQLQNFIDKNLLEQ
ncbi:MAG: diguanylate cyclase, partial [Gammaproteobacteria bacterium]